jgi:hypothetical protein
MAKIGAPRTRAFERRRGRRGERRWSLFAVGAVVVLALIVLFPREYSGRRMA